MPRSALMKLSRPAYCGSCERLLVDGVHAQVGIEVVAQAEVERQLVRQPPVVLQVAGEDVGVVVVDAGGLHHERERPGRRVRRVERRVGAELPLPVLVEVGVVGVLGVGVVAAHLEVVAALGHEQGLEELQPGAREVLRRGEVLAGGHRRPHFAGAERHRQGGHLVPHVVAAQRVDRGVGQHPALLADHAVHLRRVVDVGAV